MIIIHTRRDAIIASLRVCMIIPENYLFNRRHYCLEGIRVVHSKVSENFPVEVDILLFETVHEF